MYQIKIFDGPSDWKGTVIHSPYVNDKKAESKAHLVIEGVSDLDFTIKPNNPGWNKMTLLKSLVEFKNVRTGKVLFSGRVLQPKQSMNSDGMFSIQYICESKLAYLNDSNQRYRPAFNATIRNYLGVILDNHNAQVEPHKQFKLGNVTVTDPNDNIYRTIGYENTLATIKDKLTDRLGGYLVVREEVDGTYLDYLQEVGEVSKTKIKLRTNLKDLQKDIDPTEIITRLIPLGAKISDEEGNDERLTIKSVNNGKDYIDNKALIEEFGIIEGVITLDDVNTPSTLKLRGEQFFDDQKAATVSYTITPLDLSTIDTNFDEFVVGNWYYVVNEVLNINELLQIIELTIDVENPHLSKIVMGQKYRTLSQYQSEANKKMRNYDQLESRVRSQSATIVNLRNDYNAINQSLENIQNDLTEIDVENLPVELQSIHSDLENIQTAIDNLPTYELATPTSDGLMSSSDKIKLDGLQNYDVATELTNGLMSRTDKTIVNTVGDSKLLETENKADLVSAINELNTRLSALEP